MTWESIATSPTSCRRRRATAPSALSKQAAGRVGVVGLGVGPGLALAVVVAAGDASERGMRDQAQRGLDALLERGDGAAPRRQHHLGGHVGRGVQAVRGNAVAGVALGEVERVHDLLELALAVGLDAVVATRASR